MQDSPNFAEIAHVAGFFGARVEYPEELSEVFKKAFSHDGPAFVATGCS
jgi:thiamine pyrophosphate-dependent acetolactate synthase large subunit-like protein